jgi:hypothetical protein
MKGLITVLYIVGLISFATGEEFGDSSYYFSSAGKDVNDSSCSAGDLDTSFWKQVSVLKNDSLGKTIAIFLPIINDKADGRSLFKDLVKLAMDYGYTDSVVERKSQIILGEKFKADDSTYFVVIGYSPRSQTGLNLAYDFSTVTSAGDSQFGYKGVENALQEVKWRSQNKGIAKN